MENDIGEEQMREELMAARELIKLGFGPDDFKDFKDARKLLDDVQNELNELYDNKIIDHIDLSDMSKQDVDFVRKNILKNIWDEISFVNNLNLVD